MVAWDWRKRNQGSDLNFILITLISCSSLNKSTFTFLSLRGSDIHGAIEGSISWRLILKFHDCRCSFRVISCLGPLADPNSWAAPPPVLPALCQRGPAVSSPWPPVGPVCPVSVFLKLHIGHSLMGRACGLELTVRWVNIMKTSGPFRLSTLAAQCENNFGSWGLWHVSPQPACQALPELRRELPCCLGMQQLALVVFHSGKLEKSISFSLSRRLAVTEAITTKTTQQAKSGDASCFRVSCFPLWFSAFSCYYIWQCEAQRQMGGFGLTMKWAWGKVKGTWHLGLGPTLGNSESSSLAGIPSTEGVCQK